jgi:hypothetical protein
MSTAPRTDEQVLAYRTEDGSELVHASFAAELETELAAMQARAELAEASAKLWEADALRYANNTEFWQARAEKAEAELAAEREKVRVLRDALKVLVENGGIGPESMFDNARDAIDAAMKDISK